jgi:hypothetical protein
MIIGRPAGELGPFDRLELAGREFQWFFGRCGTGRETQDRADEACDDAHRELSRARKHSNDCREQCDRGNANGQNYYRNRVVIQQVPAIYSHDDTLKKHAKRRSSSRMAL